VALFDWLKAEFPSDRQPAGGALPVKPAKRPAGRRVKPFILISAEKVNDDGEAAP
jgi:hypothetical protein